MRRTGKTERMLLDVLDHCGKDPYIRVVAHTEQYARQLKDRLLRMAAESQMSIYFVGSVGAGLVKVNGTGLTFV